MTVDDGRSWRMNALVRRVVTGDHADLTTDAGIGVDFGNMVVIEVKFLPLAERRESETTKVIDRCEASGVEEVGQTVREVFDDAEAMVHDCGTYLNAGRAQRNKLSSVAPGSNTADAADGQVELFLARQHRRHSQRDGFDCRATEATMS